MSRFQTTIVGHANTTSGYAVGAAYYEQTPAFDVSVPVVESFSSKGGMMIDGIDRQNLISRQRMVAENITVYRGGC